MAFDAYINLEIGKSAKFRVQEFIFDHKVYAIIKEIEFDAFKYEVILFRDLNKAQAFFRSVAQNRFAREDLLKAAKWNGVANTASVGKNNPQASHTILEKLCLKIWAGELLLVEIKPAPATWFEDCCIKSIKAINGILKSHKILDNILLPSKLVLLLWYPVRSPQAVGAFSTAVGLYNIELRDISAKDWEVLAKAILAVPEITRRSVFNVAHEEAVLHEFGNKKELHLFWKGVMNAFA
jgi:hypothetical protein